MAFWSLLMASSSHLITDRPTAPWSGMEDQVRILKGLFADV